MAKSGNAAKETQSIEPAIDAAAIAKVEQIVATWADETQAEIQGWYRPEDNLGKLIAGRIEDYTSIVDENGKEREIIVLRLATPCIATIEKEPTPLTVNQMLAVGKRHHLSRLFDLERGSCVAFRAKEKVSLKGAKTMWKFELKIDPKTRKVRTALSKPSELAESNVKRLQAAQDDDAGEDLPF